MMPTAERKYINGLKRAVDEQIGVRLLEMQHDEPSVRQIKINTLKEKFKNDNAFDDTAFYIIDCFIHALGWNNSEPEIIQPFKEIKIGKQIWADRNLDVSHFRNGDPIPEARTVDEWNSAGKNRQPAWCYYENDIENGKKYGKLYNWYAVNDTRGLAPEGWHIPSDGEWIKLIDFLGGEYIAGDKLKAKSGWLFFLLINGNGTDDYSFSALPGGGRWGGGNFEDEGDLVGWWCNTEYDTANAKSRYLRSATRKVYRCNDNKEFGFSVRCLRDKTSENSEDLLIKKKDQIEQMPTTPNKKILSEFILPFKEIKIGNQIWADRNLDVSHFRNEDPIPEARRNEEWIESGQNKQPAWCYYDNDPENGEKYGKLYNWYAVSDPRGLAPVWWHIPSDEEWKILERATDTKYKINDNEWDISNEYRGFDAGSRLKSKKEWKSSDNGTDYYDFKAVPGGCRSTYGGFGHIGYNGFWWCATDDSCSHSWYRTLYYAYCNIGRGLEFKSLGFSVRCLRDNPIACKIAWKTKNEKGFFFGTEEVELYNKKDKYVVQVTEEKYKTLPEPGGLVYVPIEALR